MNIPQGIKVTPMLEQYLHWKKEYPDCLLFFRMGDFYEMFFEDAQTAASILDIVLTSRSKDSDNAIPMAGVPFHAVDSYIGKLVAAGHRVAICEQITEPDGKTLVQRSVTRVITPGTWIPENSETDGRIASCSFDGKSVSIALLTSACGSLRAGTFSVEEAASLLSSFKPDEVIIKAGQKDSLISMSLNISYSGIVERDKGEFSVQSASQWLCRKWNIATLNSMGFDDREPSVAAAYAALRYLEETQFSQAKHVGGLSRILPSEHLILDQNTQINLELTEPVNTSLYSVLNRCRTPMGKRLLKEWILSPLQDINEIQKRQDSIEILIKETKLSSSLKSLLSSCRDMAKSIGRMTLNMGSPSDLWTIKLTLEALPEIKRLVSSSEVLSLWDSDFSLGSITALLSSAVADNVPRLLRDGGVIKDGYDGELDRWRDKARNSSEWLVKFEEEERQRTGIRTLKAGVNKVFGYYIEIAKGSSDKAPSDYVRKQTLVNAERFITERLKNFEKEMFSSEDEILAIEERIYSYLIEETLSVSREIQRAAEFIAAIDVLISLAETAYEHSYVKPEMDMSRDFIIKGARHPVIEIALGHNPFTPNNFSFCAESGQRIAIITGPNMAGKSTYLRTAALIAVMAHMGSYVPAEKAKIGITDRVFTRIGARDELAKGQSTFMVEMVETANILRHATDKSLVVLDEVGRGTSTYDGLSIAWSVVEFLQGQESRQARVLFATHYHELTRLADMLPGIVNLSMAVEENQNGVTFLHKVVEAPSDRSYGIEVARLAGVPSSVLRRSKELLEQFESSASDTKPQIKEDSQRQLTLFDISQEAILEELASIDPDSMTPMEALQMVYRLRKESRKVLDFS